MNREEIEVALRNIDAPISEILAVARKIAGEWRNDITSDHVSFIKQHLNLTCNQIGKILGLTQAQVRYIMDLNNITREKGYTQSKFGILDSKTGKKYLSVDLASKDIGRSYYYIVSKKDRFTRINKEDV